MIDQPPTNRGGAWRGHLVWGVVYACLMIVLIGGLLYQREVTLREMSTPEAVARWQTWREAEPNQTTTGPVRRRVPLATEPPALVLMRDHFPVVFVGSVLFSTLLFLALMLAARGAFSRSGHTTDASEPLARRE